MEAEGDAGVEAVGARERVRDTVQDTLERAVMRLFFTAPHLGWAVVDAWPDNYGKIHGRIVKLGQVPTSGPCAGNLLYVVDEE